MPDTQHQSQHMQYFFMLGREPALSLAEIKAVLQMNNIVATEITSGHNFLILALDRTIDAPKLMNALAGTIKIGEIIQKIEKITTESLLPLVPDVDNRVVFGISTYNFNMDIMKLGKQLKKLITDQDKAARFAVSKENPLSSVAVAKNKLIEKGIEFNLFKIKTEVFIGKTLAVQDFERYSRLDYGRPAPDAKSGMLPPKLAQMMINLSGVRNNATLLDPFCGSGTVLQQAIIMGFKNVSGTDISPEAIVATTKNLEWLKKELNIDFNCTPTVADIRNIDKKIKPKSIDLIVTEPDLGPPLRGFESPQALQRIITNLEKLYHIIFEKFSIILKRNAIVVIIVPEIRAKNKTYRFNVDQMLANKFQVLGHWQYSRPNQHVVRNIYKIKAL